MNKNIDDIDRGIIAMLQENAHTRFSDMAEKLGVSNGTIHVRTKKLRQKGIIKKSTIMVDYASLGFNAQAVVGIQLSARSNRSEIEEVLVEIPEVIQSFHTMGRYDVMIYIAARNVSDVDAIIKEKIHPIQGVENSEIFIITEEVNDGANELSAIIEQE